MDVTWRAGVPLGLLSATSLASNGPMRRCVDVNTGAAILETPEFVDEAYVNIMFPATSRLKWR